MPDQPEPKESILTSLLSGAAAHAFQANGDQPVYAMPLPSTAEAWREQGATFHSPIVMSAPPGWSYGPSQRFPGGGNSHQRRVARRRVQAMERTTPVPSPDNPNWFPGIWAGKNPG